MKKEALVLLGVVLLLVALSRLNYLLFHVLVEMATVCIGISLGVIVLRSRKYVVNNFFLFLGIACSYAAVFDLIHMLSYKGMGLFPTYGSNLATQMWLVARFIESGAMLAAFYFMQRPFRPLLMLAVGGIVSALLLLVILKWQLFPDAYIEGYGLTAFKIYSEYLISGCLLLAVWLLHRQRDVFKPKTARLLLAAYLLTVCTEISFTLYQDVYGIANLTGHVCKLLAYYYLYRAVLQTDLRERYSMQGR